MAVDLIDLVGSLERAVNPPGEDFYPGTHVTEWRDRLADAFWDGYNAGFFRGYTCVEGVLTARDDGVEDLDRGMQQVIVQYAATTALKNKITTLSTSAKYQAGPVQVETQRSAQVLVQLLKDAKDNLIQLRNDLAVGRRAALAGFLDAAVVSTNRFIDGFADTYGWVT